MVIIYYGHNDAVYTLGEFKNNNFIDPDSRLIGVKDQFLINSAFAMLAREIMGNMASWVLNNNYLFDYKGNELPSQSQVFPSISSNARLFRSLYPNKLNGLIESANVAWPHAKIIFVGQSNPNCYFENHNFYRSSHRNLLCEDLLAVHRHTGKIIKSLQKQGNNNIYYEPLFLDNPYNRYGSSDAIQKNSRGSKGIAEKLTPRIKKYLDF